MPHPKASPVYSQDPALTRAYRRAFMSSRAPLVLNDLLTVFRFWDRDHYEDPTMQARIAGQRDVLIEILRKAGVLDDPLALTRALCNVHARPPEPLPQEAEVGENDLDLREE